MRILVILILSSLLNGCVSGYKAYFGSDLSVLTAIQIDGVLSEKNGQQIYLSGQLSELENWKGKGSKSDVNKNKSNEKREHLGAIISWSPEFNAAFISRDGKGCIQPATYSRAVGADVKIPAKVVKSILEGEASTGYYEQIKELIKVSDQSSFLSIGLYGICQLYANNGLSNNQVLTLTNSLFEKAANIKNYEAPVKHKDASKP